MKKIFFDFETTIANNSFANTIPVAFIIANNYNIKERNLKDKSPLLIKRVLVNLIILLVTQFEL